MRHPSLGRRGSRLMEREARLVKNNHLAGTDYIRKVPGPDLEFVEVTLDGDFVLRDDTGAISVHPPFAADVWVAVQCDRCRRFGGDVWHMGDGRWTCRGENARYACKEGAILEAWDRRYEER